MSLNIQRKNNRNLKGYSNVLASLPTKRFYSWSGRVPSRQRGWCVTLTHTHVLDRKYSIGKQSLMVYSPGFSSTFPCLCGDPIQHVWKTHTSQQKGQCVNALPLVFTSPANTFRHRNNEDKKEAFVSVRELTCCAACIILFCFHVIFEALESAVLYVGPISTQDHFNI